MLRLILGLGNVGGAYDNTRHNVGFEVLNRVATRLKVRTRPEQPESRWAVAEVTDRELLLAWPTLLMNRSGVAAEALFQRHELSPSEMLVIVDDFNLPLGRLRVRPSGSHGGHKGLLSLVETLGTDDFPRLRVGTGPLPDNTSKTDFVLGRFTPDEEPVVRSMLDSAASAVLFGIDHRLEEVMSMYNVNPVRPE